MAIVRYYSTGAFSTAKTQAILESLKEVNPSVRSLQTEKCFYVQNNQHKQLPADVDRKLHSILKESEAIDQLSSQPTLVAGPAQVVIEIGPRFNFSTASSTNSVSICNNLGLEFIERIEVSTRYLVGLESPVGKDEAGVVSSLLGVLHDPMTQCQYTQRNVPVNDFYETISHAKEDWYFVPLLEKGRKALEEINVKNGLAFDEWDLEYYTNLFVKVLKRNPTNVELFDCAQCNSEHSRHWFFKGKISVDGKPKAQSLIEMICDTQRHTNPNNTVKFSDNSSAIQGYQHQALRASTFDGPGQFVQRTVRSDLIFTAETHNMPTAVSPFSGATTGTGGRLRDVQSIGRGGLPIAGTAGYCVGMLNIPGHKLPYESQQDYPGSFAHPLKVLIEASDGASDYGNKFGEPLICGFAISYGAVQTDGRRNEYVKPIMFSGGVGTMDSDLVDKKDPKKGMLLAKLGGPVYRIGVGGGAASSVEVQGDSTNTELDFNAVQRGDAEMENKLNRVVRACIELGDQNPILAIHDQGAGGNCNVLKELVEPGCAGAVIFSKAFQLGDPTISTLELWGAEYQENNAVLVDASSRELLQRICDRERCPVSFVGTVTGTGYVTLVEQEFDANADKFADRSKCTKELSHVAFDMHLDHVLGKMPQKEFKLTRLEERVDEFKLTPNVKLPEALGLVLSAATVGSKRYLTNKVDRSVTGLIAQQQCVGPLHTPLADFGLVAVSHFAKEGIATSIGAQPIKGLVDPAKAARMTVAEALSNLVFVAISELADVKCSGNWMWAAKVPGEGAKLVDACEAMCELMNQLHIAIDGGKDSLSMAARVHGETVVSPGTLVVSTYAPCPDVTVKVTPDLKAASLRCDTTLLYVAVEGLRFRLGGSVLAQCYGKLGGDCPDISNPECLKNAFNVTQELLRKKLLLSGHDCSDGGLVTSVLEMAFAGLTAVELNLEQLLPTTKEKAPEAAVLQVLFAEECGWVLEVLPQHVSDVLSAFRQAAVPCYTIGRGVGMADLHSGSSVTIRSGTATPLLKDSLFNLFNRWESTSFEIEKLQKAKATAIEEYTGMERRTGPRYVSSLDPDTLYASLKLSAAAGPRVALIREEGTNGDREMAAALFSAGFEVHDVVMNDLLQGRTTLDRYRGIVFPGGFSYADTLGSAKGWAACIQYNGKIAPQFEHFRMRTDTFSLGVCNGCQLMGLIGWVDTGAEKKTATTPTTTSSQVLVPEVVLVGNRSEKFESRWITVKIPASKSIMLRRLAGSTLGCWVAHGEGRFSFRTDEAPHRLAVEQCVTMQYVDDAGTPTERYPMNPNGSPLGIAGLCSPDGRHLAIMPHPERCVQMWQWPYVTVDFRYRNASPWMSMFYEAYLWCLGKQ